MEKRRVAIVTIESNNYGNRLQNYALQEVLKSLDCEVVTLRRNEKKKGVKSLIKGYCNTLLRTKISKFSRFNQVIQFSDEIIGKDSYPNGLENSYDFFVCGSDQIWNPHYDFVGGKCDFLAFAPKHKKIAYAPSFGVSMIPEEKRNQFSLWLSDIAHLSVREKAGADIIKELTGKEAQVVLDPTMLIEVDHWKSIVRKTSCIPKNKYVLVYSLGKKSKEFEDAVEYYSKDFVCFDVRQIGRLGKEIPIGPAEFLYAIKNAEVILTDSFHCTVFSILFEKKVHAFDRTGMAMNSRIKTLFDSLGITVRDYKEIQIDYTQVFKNLQVLKDESIQYLKESLNTRQPFIEDSKYEN